MTLNPPIIQDPIEAATDNLLHIAIIGTTPVVIAAKTKTHGPKKLHSIKAKNAFTKKHCSSTPKKLTPKARVTHA